ncbi:S41 family peptidase [Cellulophaga sp. HaHa_2_95]|uniref:S41 family peptidase n=1 Tax=Cellulophaga sp. HaHa_2_95 TaxID=2745558 RepID=UPI001C4EEC89|nr:S41 family peptidase [Cellulophaga sp. HaHa_2_95]QXP57272.1 S41 family peptidase [Cellulophaga sp. HaHa_2_95]
MSNKKIYFQVLVLMVVFTSCSKSQNTPQKPENQTVYWHAPSKGYVLESVEGTNKLYGVSAAGNVLIDANVLPENYANLVFTEEGNQLVGTSDLFIDKVYFYKLTDTTTVFDSTSIDFSVDPKINAEHFWNLFNDYYAFFDLRDVNWEANLSLLPTVTSENLYPVLEQMVQPLNDFHIGIFNQEVNITSGEARILEHMNAHLTAELQSNTFPELLTAIRSRVPIIHSKYLDDTFNSDPNGNMFWGLVTDEIGYFNIANMGGYAPIKDEITAVNHVMDQVMNDIQQANIDKIIIDLRFNGGGFDGIALEIASRFTSNSRPIFTIKSKSRTGFTEEQAITLNPKGDYQFSGEIVLLTSPFTASAAEIFVLSLKDLPNVTIVGEHTMGIFSSILTHRLPNGTYINLSNQVYTDTFGTVFEGIGIGPAQENKVPFLSTEDFNSGLDSGIEKGITILE